MTDGHIMDAVQAMWDEIARHDDHEWEQIGRCVYCADCSQRLYQGTIGPTHTKVRRRRQGQEPKSTTEMRKRWGKS